jgi:hypothetical protein
VLAVGSQPAGCSNDHLGNKRVRNANTKRNGKSIKNKETYKRKKVLSQQTPKKGPWISRKIKPPITSLSPKVKRGNKKKQGRRNSTLFQ